MGEQRQDSALQKSVFSLKNRIDLELSSKDRRLDFNLVFTDLEFSHRYVLFRARRKDLQRVYDRLNELIQTYLDDAKVEEYDLTVDNEHELEAEAHARPAPSRLDDEQILDLNFMVISNCEGYADLSRKAPLPEETYAALKKTQTCLGFLYSFREEELRQVEKWRRLGQWYFAFKERLAEVGFDATFYELRPLKLK